jgi:PAS domain S-box-containing protein
MVFFSVILMLNLWLCLFLSGFVYYKNPSANLNRFALVYCLATSYQVLVNFGLTVAGSAEVAMVWVKIGSFTIFIIAISLHLVVYFTERRGLLRSKVFYILNYGWPLVFSLIDLFTNLTIGEVVWDGAFWVTTNPIDPALALGKSVLIDIALVLVLVTYILYLVMVRDEIRRAQTLFIIFGLLLLYTTGLYIPALGLTLICYAISRYGVNALTPRLTTEIVMNRLPEVLLYVDPAGRVQFADDAACLILNYSREELVGQRFDNISTEGGIMQDRVKGFQKIKDTGHAGNLELTFRGKSGQQVPLLVSIAELRGPTGSSRGLLYLGRELAPIKKRESEWAKGQQELELDSVIKADFLALQSTELMKTTKTILENIRILLDPHGEPLGHSQKQRVDAILEASEGLEKMGQEMHEISRAGKDLYSLHRESIPLKPLLESILKLFTDDAQKQDVMLVSEVPDTIGNLSADKRMIQQIVYNLVSNAVRFTPGGGQVGIKAQRLSNAIQITVSDTGIGIAPEDLDKLFQAFKTVQTPVSKKYEGRGLGLYFCKRFITQHGGRIWVESQVGKGSKFHFTIPTDREK